MIGARIGEYVLTERLGGLAQARAELVAARRARIAPIAALFLAEAHARVGRLDVARRWCDEAGEQTDDLDVAQRLSAIADAVRSVAPAWADHAKAASDAHFATLGVESP